MHYINLLTSKLILLIYGVSLQLLIASGLDYSLGGYMTDNSNKPTYERIDFAFVLLPEDKVGTDLIDAADHLQSNLLIRSESTPKKNKVMRIAHVSMGQYSITKDERPKIELIINELAQQYHAFKETINPALFIKPNYIQLNFDKVRDNTNPLICELYIKLRENFFRKIDSKKPLMKIRDYLEHGDCTEDEKENIEKYYLPLGFPDNNTYIPHFTLIYNFDNDANDCERTSAEFHLPAELQTIDFKYLGVFAIDEWGNPRPEQGYYKVPLRKEENN